MLYYKCRVRETVIYRHFGGGPPPAVFLSTVPVPQSWASPLINTGDALCVSREKKVKVEDYVDGSVPGPLKAGNTCETLAPIRLEASVAESLQATNSDASAEEQPVLETDDNLFDVVSRKEFEELQDAFVRLITRINRYNVGAAHKI